MKAILAPGKVSEMGHNLGIHHTRYGLLWDLGVETGLRIGDLLTLRPQDFGPQISLVQAKNGQRYVSKLSGSFLKKIDKYVDFYKLRADEFIFFSSDPNRYRPMSRQWAHRIIARTASEMGLEFIGAHSMRKIYACRLFLKNRALKCVQDEMGHKYSSTTLIYLQDLLGEDLRAG